jgi:hypothetical protein
MHHYTPIRAGLELSSVGTIAAAWMDKLPTVLTCIATAISALWYAYCLYDALQKKKIKRKKKR